MRDDDDIKMVSDFLRNEVGIVPARVRPSTTPSEKRCDLVATDESEQYLIEVGGFDDNPVIRQTDELGGHYDFEPKPYHYLDQVTKKLRTAQKQLRGTASMHPDHLWLVGLIARSAHDPDHMMEQIRGTIYGMADIIERRGADSYARYRCLYFDHSGFYRHRQLDGSFVICQRRIALYINDYGRQIERVRRSQLARYFKKHNAMYDKHEWEHRQELVADFEVDRNDKQAVLTRLNQKYPNRNLQISPLRHYI
jgi:hypothetical protein